VKNPAFKAFMQAAQLVDTRVGPYSCWWPGCVGELTFKTAETEKMLASCPSMNVDVYVDVCAQIITNNATNGGHVDHNIYKQVCKKNNPTPAVPSPFNPSLPDPLEPPTPIVNPGDIKPSGEDEDECVNGDCTWWQRTKSGASQVEKKVEALDKNTKIAIGSFLASLLLLLLVILRYI
jgi:hypothetical protein